MLLEPKRTPYDLRWPMFGIPVRVHPFFWLTAVLLNFRARAPLSEVAIWVACVFVSILLHEFGHALTARFFGARNLRVWLWAMGGLACHDGGPTGKQRIVELIMGPGAGFILWGILFGVSKSINPVAVNPYVWLALEFLLQINLYWGLLNLIPVYPLDGGQILMEFSILRRGRGRGVEQKVHGMSIAFAVIAAFGLTAFDFFRFQKLHIFYLIMFGWLGYINWQLRKVARMGAYDGQEGTRQPWERDGDWWKKG